MSGQRPSRRPFPRSTANSSSTYQTFTPTALRLPQESSPIHSALAASYRERNRSFPRPESSRFERYLSFYEMEMKLDMQSIYHDIYADHATRSIHERSSHGDRYGAQNIYFTGSPLLPLESSRLPDALVMDKEYTWTTTERFGIMAILERVRTMKLENRRYDIFKEMGFDEVLLAMMADVKCPYFFSFGYRYCLGDCPPLTSLPQVAPRLDRVASNVIGAGLIDYGDQEPRLLTMDFLPGRGHISERVPSVMYRDPMVATKEMPATEHIILRSPGRDSFEISEIKLALWPDVRGRAKVRCAVFLVNEMTPSLAKTLAHDIEYVKPDMQQVHARYLKNPLHALVTTKPLEPREFSELVPGGVATVVRSKDRQLEFRHTDRGITGGFGEGTQMTYNFRVDKQDPHLVPTKLEYPHSTFQSMTKHVLDEMQREEEPMGRPRGNQDVPFLVPNAMVELDDRITTLKFFDAAKTGMIVLKLWKSKRDFDESMFRVMEVHGFEGLRTFKTEMTIR